MKRIHPLIFSALFGALFASGGIYWAARVGDAKAAAEPPVARAVLKVEALSCGKCEGRIRTALEGKPGVAGVSFNLENRTVNVDFREGETTPEALAEAVTKSGYPAAVIALGPAAPDGAGAPPARRGGCGGGCGSDAGANFHVKRDNLF